MKLGFSIPPQWFNGKDIKVRELTCLHEFGGIFPFLNTIKAEGISSVELRYVSKDDDPDHILQIVQAIWDAGLTVTIHGNLRGEYEGTRFSDMYPSISQVLKHYKSYQDQLVMTIHPYLGDANNSVEMMSKKTADLIKNWILLTQSEDLSVAFAIELNRVKPGKIDPGGSCNELINMMNSIDSPLAGICWDMGHFYSNQIKEAGYSSSLPEQLNEELPPEKFVQHTIHTHIHGLGVSGTTHCPLTEANSLPLERYVLSLIESGFKGVLNLELDVNRFPEDKNLYYHVMTSIRRLNKCISVT